MKLIKIKLPFGLDKIRQVFGYTDFCKANPTIYKAGFHTGVDFGAPIGTPIRAAHNGIVVIDKDLDAGGYGIYVTLWDPEQDIATLYGHMVSNCVVKDQIIKRDDVIGWVGDTGVSKGPHTHFELLLTNNGYIIPQLPARGAINPLVCAEV